MVMTDRRELRNPILGAILLLLSSFPSTASVTDRHKHNGPSRVSFENTSTLGIWVLDHFFDLHDEPAGRTFIAMTDRHNLRNPTLGQTSPSSFSSFSTLPPMDRHMHDGPS